MRNRMYGGVRGRKTRVGRKLLRFLPTRFIVSITLPTGEMIDRTEEMIDRTVEMIDRTVEMIDRTVEMMDRTTEMTPAYLVTTLMMHLGSRPASLAYLT